MLEKIKQIALEMSPSPDKRKALEAYKNLKTIEVIAKNLVRREQNARRNNQSRC